MTKLDPRRNAFRRDLADVRLKGRVEAPRFVEGSLYQVVDGTAPVRREPNPMGALETQALCGEIVRVFEETGEGWAWGQLEGDGYVGWLPTASLRAEVTVPTHRVAARSTFLFPGPDIKLPPLMTLPLGAEVAVTGEAQDKNARYGLVEPAGAVVMQHLSPVEAPREPDWTAVAESFLGVPYLWGGKTDVGIDCSGLVQIALHMAGRKAPRDADMQAAEIGEALEIGDDLPPLRRGDLIFWEGHVGLMRDGETLLHANAFHMCSASEPLVAARSRFAAKGLKITAIRRLQ
ncbi:NlpC/P60 family protein [Afifella sp. JA880]|uniref:C40 family peptidase n=1 Tax=Afifella sp. JA880 TaxID=2975280 RepID=UPI0021BB648C|nr:NlpC/P60 family protein [Afifella sp. JA880]MCT8268948.1 NlpC/P60 family protein [Afifella sp. JA880]